MRRLLKPLAVLSVLGFLAAPALADREPNPLPPCGEFDLISMVTTIFPASGWDPDPGCDVNTAPPPGCGGEDLVFGDQEHWEAFWDIHQPWTSPPEVDFSQRLAIVSFQGWRRTGGYGNIVECVRYYESTLIPGTIDRVRVELDDVSPGSTCNVSQSTTNPYTIGTILRPATPLLGPPEVEFAHTPVVTDCGSSGGSGECEHGICGTGGVGGFGNHTCCPEP